MSVIQEEILEEKEQLNKQMHHDEELIRFQGKNVKIAKFRKKIHHKPRLFGVVLINLSIIIGIIIIILLIM
ncbi:MAG: hypothetical protein EU532_10960 [Promethearchaeota archaeon]|nr:MAG: hypothetical protein EU532_10960 [Candidatus Lokiarchaeota archaeon]